MILTDFHVHSSFSSDSESSLESMIEKGIQLGLEKICFTDHMDIDYPNKYGLSFVFQVDEYFKKLEELKTKYKNKIKIFKGIEFGLAPYLSAQYAQLVKDYKFDFIIGSSHLVNGIDPYYPEYWQNKSEEEGYLSYFETIIENVKAFSEFDVYGHIDYIVRYGPNKNQNYSYVNYADIIDQLLLTIINANKGIEINSSGLKYGLGQFHPKSDVLTRYKELGGELITIGSDAHKPEHLAYEFDKIRPLLLDLGFKYYATFEKRTPVFHKL